VRAGGPRDHVRPGVLTAVALGGAALRRLVHEAEPCAPPARGDRLRRARRPTRYPPCECFARTQNRPATSTISGHSGDGFTASQTSGAAAEVSDAREPRIATAAFSSKALARLMYRRKTSMLLCPV